MKKMSVKLPRSPLAPKNFPVLPPIEGVALASYASGSRYHGRDDLLLVQFAKATKVAGVFTTSKMPSAAVDWSRTSLKAGRSTAAALVVNAGIANAFTGKAGARAAQRTAKAAAQFLKSPVEKVFIASTGVIGAALDPAPLVAAIQQMAPELARQGLGQEANHEARQIKISAARWQKAAEAIMTTDTFPKGATREVRFGKQNVTLNAIAKGSGMIAPDMATMLAFVFTDAAISASLLQKLLVEANVKSLNAITVDSDTSTSDTCLLFATGYKKLDGPALRSIDDKRLAPFRTALLDVMQDIAIQIACDGEGASKLIVIDVSGAENDAAARRIGLAVGNSPLVKTAVAGEDANWGRVVMAIGKSGERVERDRLAIDIGGHKVARKGCAVANYDEAPIARHMKDRRIRISVDVGARAGKGRGQARIWASDLTHGYISLNADYRS